MQLKTVAEKFEAFSLSLDESTDCKDISQLSIFIRGVDSNFDITEELLKLVSIYSTTKGIDIFEKLLLVLTDFKLPLNKLVSITTDGASAP
jgi:hypothetical protein